MDIGLAAALRHRYGVYAPSQCLVVLTGTSGSGEFSAYARPGRQHPPDFAVALIGIPSQVTC